MPNEIKERARAFRLALIDNDEPGAAPLQSWLMGKAASAMLHQDTESLLALRAALADLPPVADRFGTGRRGDRWRAVWELVDALCETPRPLEQVRLSKATQVSGQVLQLIGDQPGICPGDIARQLGKRGPHVSNVLRSLMDQGLVHRLAEGRTGRCFLTSTGREMLAAMLPSAAETAPPEVPNDTATDSVVPRAGNNDYPYFDRLSPSHWPEPTRLPNFMH